MQTTVDKGPITEREQAVVFRLGTERYGIDIFRVSEIVRPQVTTRLPRSEDHISGLINLRGKTIPVIDLHRRLALPPTSETGSSRIVVVEGEGSLVGLTVDEVIEVLTLEGSKIEAAPAFGGGEEDNYVRGVAKHGERLIVLLDLDRTLQSPLAP